MSGNEAHEIPEGLSSGEPEENEELEGEGEGDDEEVPFGFCPVCLSQAVLPEEDKRVHCYFCEQEWPDLASYRADVEASHRRKIDFKRIAAFIYLNKDTLVKSLHGIAKSPQVGEIKKLWDQLSKFD